MSECFSKLLLLLQRLQIFEMYLLPISRRVSSSQQRTAVISDVYCYCYRRTSHRSDVNNKSSFLRDRWRSVENMTDVWYSFLMFIHVFLCHSFEILPLNGKICLYSIQIILHTFRFLTDQNFMNPTTKLSCHCAWVCVLF